jgi:hypothetical protein
VHYGRKSIFRFKQHIHIYVMEQEVQKLKLLKCSDIGCKSTKCRSDYHVNSQTDTNVLQQYNNMAKNRSCSTNNKVYKLYALQEICGASSNVRNGKHNT